MTLGVALRRFGRGGSLGVPCGTVLSFHGVVERVDDPKVQLNHIDLATFRRILDLVSTSHEVVSLDVVVDALLGGVPTPECAVALTFDDGYRSTLELAHPLLRERGLPYTVFVSTRLIDIGGRLPTYFMRAALPDTDVTELRLDGVSAVLPLRTEAERLTAEATVQRLLKTSPEPEVRAIVDSLRALLTPDRWAALDRRFASEALLTWNELRAIAADGATIGAHCHDHAILHRRQDPAEVVRQITTATARVEAELGRRPRHFAYPNGTKSDVTREAVQALAAAGYDSGFANIAGTVRRGFHRLLLPRVPVTSALDHSALDAQERRDRAFQVFAASVVGGSSVAG